MVHVHSLSRRRTRYRRALAKGYIYSPYPIGSIPAVSVGPELPQAVQKQLLNQFQVTRVALAVHLVISCAYGPCSSLGRAYQSTRAFLPQWIKSGLRRLHRAFVSIRHKPLLYVPLPVPLNFATQVHKAIINVTQRLDTSTLPRCYFGKIAAAILLIQKFFRTRYRLRGEAHVHEAGLPLVTPHPVRRHLRDPLCLHDGLPHVPTDVLVVNRFHQLVPGRGSPRNSPRPSSRLLGTSTSCQDDDHSPPTPRNLGSLEDSSDGKASHEFNDADPDEYLSIQLTVSDRSGKRLFLARVSTFSRLGKVTRPICLCLGLERSMVLFTVDDTCIGDNDTMVTLGLIFNYITVTVLRGAVGDEVEHNSCQRA